MTFNPNAGAAARGLIELLNSFLKKHSQPSPSKEAHHTTPAREKRDLLTAFETLLLALTPGEPMYAAFHDGQVHDPLGGGSYAFQDDLVQPLLGGIVHDERLSIGGSPNSKEQATRDIPARPIIIHAGAQPNNSPHCGTLIVFCYAFAVARAIRDRIQTLGARIGVEFQPPPVSVGITFVDTAPVHGKSMEINGVHYQRSYRDVPDAMATWVGDYLEVLTLLSNWSEVPFATDFQSDFFSNPHIPQLLHYLIANRHVIGVQLSPKHGTLGLRAACPVQGCALAEKHGHLNQYSTATDGDRNADPRVSKITFHCPDHGPHTLQLSDPSRLEANAPTRNLLRSMVHLLDPDTHHIRVTGADYAGTYQEAFLYRPLAEWSATTRTRSRGRTPHILYAPLVVDWSGAKLSKSLYVREGGYRQMELFGTDGLAGYGVLKERTGREGLRRLWEEVVRWVANPRRLFRCYSVEYLRGVVIEGKRWETEETAE